MADLISENALILILEEALQNHEGQTVEFMEAFPKNARELGKEIAAFSTSNTGFIFLGITDDCQIKGISVVTPKERDGLRNRIVGVAATIRPSARVSVCFLKKAAKIIPSIIIEKGEKPVYYLDEKPYIRDNADSRPARPDEVEKLYYSAFILSPLEPDTDAARRSGFLDILIQVLSQIDMVCNGLPIRKFNPSLQNAKIEMELFLNRVTELVVDSISNDFSGLATRLINLRKLLLVMTSIEWSEWSNWWTRWLEIGKNISSATKSVVETIRPYLAIPEDTKRKLLEDATKCVKSLKLTWDDFDNASKQADGLTKLKERMLVTGELLYPIGYRLELVEEERGIRLKKVSAAMRDIETYEFLRGSTIVETFKNTGSQLIKEAVEILDNS
jgi:ATP-dependent DNA helicase RecG